MFFRKCSVLLVLLSSCATPGPSPKPQAAGGLRLANLQRAAALPWTDNGRCAVREAENEWPVLAERCVHALDHERVRFRDVTGRCALAQAGAAAVGGAALCILAAPELVVGAVVVVGVVVVAIAIEEALDAYERRGPVEPEAEAGRKGVRPAPQPQPVQEPLAGRGPKPEPKPGGASLGRDWLPPDSVERERRSRCEPIPVPHAGGHDPHNMCADKIPQNSFAGWDVLVNGKQFDALQMATRTLWDVKTDNFDIHSPRSQDFLARVKLPELQREKRLAEECGYGFVVGVKSAAHKAVLERLDKTLAVVVMDWC